MLIPGRKEEDQVKGEWAMNRIDAWTLKRCHHSFAKVLRWRSLGSGMGRSWAAAPSPLGEGRGEGFILACLLLLLPLLSLTPAVAAEAAPEIKLEIRLASHEPVEGWVELRAPRGDRPVYLAPEITIANKDIAQAWLERSGPEMGVGVLMTDDGALALARLTRNHVGELVAFVIDGRVVSVPRIAGEISRRALILGNFTEEEAKAIAAAFDGE
jgi:hypothetical protein